MPVHICQEQLNLLFSGLIVFDSCAFTVPSIHPVIQPPTPIYSTSFFAFSQEHRDHDFVKIEIGLFIYEI